MMNHLNKVTAFAPATSANFAAGFDILGFAVEDLGDEVTVEKSYDQSLKIVAITGSEQIPYEAGKNTARIQRRISNLGKAISLQASRIARPFGSPFSW